MSVDVLGGISSEFTEARRPAAGRPRAGSGGMALPVVLGPRPERVYSHSLLLELQEHPLARQWPPYLDPAFKNSRGVWDPDRWHLERKRGETPIGLEKKDGPDAKENQGKGRDKEGKKGNGGGLGPDGEDLQQLVLSPQRRSFLSGCTSGSGPGEQEVSLRPEQPGAGAKRVGSGRLLARQERQERGEDERGFRRGEDYKGRYPDNRRDDKFGSGFRGRGERDEEGGWGSEDRRRDGFYQHDDRRGDGRRNDDRRPQRRRNEPEWMNETVSHNDVIELRGFDDKPTKKKETSPPGTLPLSLSLGNVTKNGNGPPPPGLPSSGISVEDLEKQQQKPPTRMNVGSNDQNQNIIDEDAKNDAMQQNLNNIDILNDLGIVPKTDDDHYNFDQIMESMINITDHVTTPKSAPKSRFSQFFNKGQNMEQHHQVAAKHDSRRSSIQDELLGANILKEINGDSAPLIKIPSPTEEERYFAPISPAAQTRAAPNPLMEMINKGQGQGNPPKVQDLEENLRRQLGLGQGHHPQVHPQNLQDLFKSVQQQQGHPQNNNQPQFGHLEPQQQPPMMGRMQPPVHQQQPPKEPENMSAFKKLVAMVGQNNEPQPQGPPFGPGVVRPSPLPAPVSIPSNAPTEQEILDQMIHQQQPGPPRPPKHGGGQLPPGIANFLAGHPLNLELVSRPEGKQLLVGLESGNITVDHLVQQVNNPALQQRQRDVLLSVLKLVTMQRQGGNHPPPFLPPGPPVQHPPHPDLIHARVSPLMFPPGAGGPPTAPTHLSVSPVPQQARVPSPQEMTVLTQQIMQQALIKRKLEEQKENYRKKHGEPNNGSQPSPTPLAFTPTSVMRKNAAERKDSDPQIKPQLPELKITSGKEIKEDLQGVPTSPGRAITKGKDERPSNLDLAAGAGQSRRLSPHQMFPPSAHSNPLMYLQNNPLNPVSHSMLSQANAMAQQQLAASLMAQGIDPRQLGPRVAPPQGPRHVSGPGHVSPIRGGPPPLPGLPPQFAGLVSPPQGQAGQGGGGPLARFFSPEVLAAAQSGAMPAMPPMPSLAAMAGQDGPAMPTQQQKALTLEEIERQAAAVRM